MDFDNDSNDPITRREMSAFVFGYLNCVAEVIKQTISEANTSKPNPEAVKFTTSIAREYITHLHSTVSERLDLEPELFHRLMTDEVKDVIDTIAHEAWKSMSILEDNIKPTTNTNWREDNR